MQYNRNANLPQVNVSCVNTALVKFPSRGECVVGLEAIVNYKLF